MKTILTKLFLAVIFLCLASACSRSEKTAWITSKNVTVAWDATTTFEDGTPIGPDVTLRYNVYIDRDSDDTHEDMELVTREPIAGTSYTIDSIEYEGRYFIGVQTVASRVRNGEKEGEPIISRISWSSNKADTQSGKFGIRIK